MHRIGEEIHVETDEARGGATPGIMRYVLLASLALAILALSAVWISKAISLRPPSSEPVTAEEYALGG